MLSWTLPSSLATKISSCHAILNKAEKGEGILRQWLIFKLSQCNFG